MIMPSPSLRGWQFARLWAQAIHPALLCLSALLFILAPFALAVEMEVLSCPGGPWDYCEVRSDAIRNIQNTMTIEARVYWKGPLPKKAQQSIVIKGEIQKTWSHSLALTDGRLTYKTRMYDLTAGEPIPIKIWTHVAITIQDSTAVFYVNGAKVGELPGAIIENYDFPLYISGWWATWGLTVDLHTAPFNGLITDVRVWRTARTAAEIKDNSKRLLSGNESGLVANWRGIKSYTAAPDLSLKHIYYHTEPPASPGNLRVVTADVPIEDDPGPQPTPAPAGPAIACPADFDGDGRTDPAWYWPASGTWIMRLSSTGKDWRTQWGWSEAIPVPFDYDGDRAADLAVYWAAGREYIIWLSGSKQAWRVKP